MVLVMPAVALLATATPAHAETTVLEVTSTDDLPLGGGVSCPAQGDDICTLRAATMVASTDPDVGVDYRIVLPAGSHVLDGTELSLTAHVDRRVTIEGAGRDVTVIDGDQATRILAMNNDIDRDGEVGLTLEALTVRDARASTSGGAIFAWDSDIVIDDVAFVDNAATQGTASSRHGGAIYLDGGTLLVERAVFQGNWAGGTSGSNGGAIWHRGDTLVVRQSVFDGNSSPEVGGAVYSRADSVEVGDTTFVDNGLGLTSNGAALYVYDDDEHDETATPVEIVNSTVTESRDDPNLTASALATNGDVALTLDSVTIAGFASEAIASFLSVNEHNTGSVHLRNTIIDAAPCSGSGSFTSDGGNLAATAQVATDCGLDPGGVDPEPAAPMLDALADNGGPTPTHALLPGSPAIDGGATDLATDQRGEPRDDGSPDVGAFELQGGGGVGSGLVEGDTVVVNSSADAALDDPGAEVCDTGTTISGGSEDAVGEVGTDEPTCTLRAAVQATNNAAGVQTIVLPAGTYALTLEGDGGAEVGDLEVTDELELIGAGTDVTTIDAEGLGDRIFEVVAAAALSITDVTLTGAALGAHGGAVLVDGAQFTAERAALVGNRSFFNTGGAVRATAGSVVTLVDTTIGGNTANSGGGVAVNGATLVLERSTVSGNDVSNQDNLGGGVQVGGEDGVATIVNSTISGNTAGVAGGGLYVTNGTALVDSSTIADNHLDPGDDAPEGAAGIEARNNATVTLRNSIVADNAGEQCHVTASGSTAIVSAGHNLDDDGTCGLDPDLGDHPGADAGLLTLQDAGGHTATHPLSAGSAAVDANAGCEDAQATDQRGVSRPGGGSGGCDLGAFELEPQPPAPPPSTVPPPSDTDDEDDAIEAGDPGVVAAQLVAVCEEDGVTFVDAADSVHAGALGCLAAIGLFEGYDDDHVGPGDDVTRGQTASLLLRLVGGLTERAPDELCPDAANPFPDGGDTHGDAIACVHQLGVLAGHGDGTFRPGEPITRAQAAAVLVRAARVVGFPLPAGDPVTFDDVPADNVHAEAVASLRTVGVLNGYTPTRFGPGDRLTRGQFASAVERLLRFVAEHEA
jgi:hypothetical protein